MEKKKLFISCPMNGASKEEIDKRMHILHKLAELHFGKDLEVIDTWINEEAPQKCKNNRVWYAGESIKRLSEADYYDVFKKWIPKDEPKKKGSYCIGRVVEVNNDDDGVWFEVDTNVDRIVRDTLKRMKDDKHD